MKLNSLIILVFSAILALFHASCALTLEQRATLTSNALKDGVAAGGGYLIGGQPGAVVGLAAQMIKNHTSAKQPVEVQ